jgi:hypothetical protein
VVRDNGIVFGAGWIDSIQTAPGRKVRYRVPELHEHAVVARTEHKALPDRQ